jgi:acetylornithine deacetylase/succinyl-diaminopimelate desuccinylase family protein
MGRSLSGPEIYEERVTNYLEDFFRSLDVPYERQPVAPQRANIVARFQQPGARRTLMFEAHQDTVPPDNMTVEPFAAKVEGDRLYGRGACDIKGGLAAMLAAFARIVRERPAGACNLIMACSVDEEYTFLGVQRLVRDLKADGAIVAEPTQLEIVNAHKGVVRWFINTAGRSCHSSSPDQGVNAIYRMGRLLVGIEKYAAGLHLQRKHERLGAATLSVGRIEGGTSANVVPDRCRIEVDRRVLPGEDPLAAPDDLVAFLRDREKIDFPFECERPWMSKTPLSDRGSEPLADWLGGAIDQVCGGHRVTAVPYGTDASTLAAAGVPAVVFGPGNIAQAHTSDEWVPLAEVAQAAEILYRLALSA